MSGPLPCRHAHHPDPPALADVVVALRPWDEADVAQQLKAFADPVFAQHSDWAPHDDAEARQRLRDQEQARLRGEQIDLAVVDLDNRGLVLGGISLNSVDVKNARASLGYWLAPAARGRGAASRAVRLVAGWAFGTLGLARLEITCGPDNHGSQRVADAAASVVKGCCRSHQAFSGGRRDTVMFSLLLASSPSEAPSTAHPGGAPAHPRGGGSAER